MRLTRHHRMIPIEKFNGQSKQYTCKDCQLRLQRQNDHQGQIKNLATKLKDQKLSKTFRADMAAQLVDLQRTQKLPHHYATARQTTHMCIQCTVFHHPGCMYAVCDYCYNNKIKATNDDCEEYDVDDGHFEWFKEMLQHAAQKVLMQVTCCYDYNLITTFYLILLCSVVFYLFSFCCVFVLAGTKVQHISTDAQYFNTDDQ